MKLSIFATILLISSLFLSCKKTVPFDKAVNTAIKPGFELLWETDTIFKTTESCLYDPKHEVIYVSNVNNAPRTKDNNGFISTLNKNGKVQKLKWATGMSAPKGMAYFNETLYVTDIDAVVEIDPHHGTIKNRHTLEGALMLNDLAVDDLGVVYVSAMDTNKIYMLEDGDFTLWKDNLNKPNGLLVQGNSLLVASMGDGTLKTFDRTTKEEKQTLATDTGKSDGIVKLKSGAYAVSNWLGEIFHVKDGKTTLIYNTLENDKLQTADIGVISDDNIILIPTFFGNSVKAYKLKE